MIVNRLHRVFLLSFLVLVAEVAGSQTAHQARATSPSELTVDDAFDPPITAPAFRAGKGPVVVVDEKHRNVVSLQTYFRPVGRHLGKDGYRVRPGARSFTARDLAAARVLIIANAQAPEDSAPGTSAFTDAEVPAVEAWVSKGGGLFLIADRAPFGGPARSLAGAFHATLDDNTVLRKGLDGKPDGVLTIDVAADGEKSHPVFEGVSRVVYVVGESLDGPGPILRAPAGTYSGATNQSTDGPSAAGKPIALAFSHGKGRVVIIGDAGITSAFGSVGGATHRGISEADNSKFIRNVVRWLAR